MDAVGRGPDLSTDGFIPYREQAMDVDTQQPHHVEQLWFEDGNVVLQAGNAQYRVYRGTLARRSPVFRDLFSVPQPQDAELVEGCPFVRLPDEEVEVTPFLQALFDTEFFLPFPETTTFVTVYGCLRLAHKYEVLDLRRRALVHLSSRFRTTLDQESSLLHDRWNRATDFWKEAGHLPDQTSWNDVVFNHPEVVRCVIQLAREVDAPWVLPSAFYHLVSANVLDSRLFVATSCAGITATALSAADQTLILHGCDSLSRATQSVIHAFNSPQEDKWCRSSSDCSKNRLNIIGENQDMFHTYQRDPLRVWTDRDDWDRYVGYVCGSCKSTISDAMDEARRAFWQALPAAFDLPAWEELEKAKTAAIGGCFVDI
ncbi:BTB domain-containing protein [Mycena kentingensis (nom. inval.)]|nr:BTB domain-containing protein [Mycena kentingensis (nom. inval.)]